MSGASTVPMPLKFRICDIRGLEQEHLMAKENMRYVLEGNIADKFPVCLIYFCLILPTNKGII